MLFKLNTISHFNHLFFGLNRKQDMETTVIELMLFYHQNGSEKKEDRKTKTL